MAANDVTNQAQNTPRQEPEINLSTIGMTSGAPKIDRDPYRPGVQDVYSTVETEQTVRALAEFRTDSQRRFLSDMGIPQEAPTVPYTSEVARNLSNFLPWQGLRGARDLVVDAWKSGDPSRASLPGPTDIANGDIDLAPGFAATKFVKNEHTLAAKAERGLSLAA